MQRYSYNQLKKCEQEKIRIKACKDVRLKKLSRNQVVSKFNITLPSLKLWLSKYDAGGITSLSEQKTGRPVDAGTKLSNKQFKKLSKIIETKTPDQFGLPFFLWCREAIKALIKKEFQVDYSISHISDLMQKLGFTVQKPILKYGEQNPDEVKRWLKEEYPKLVKRVKAEKGEIHWGDETGVQNKANSERSYAPKGKTPVFKKSGKRLKKSIISSVTNQGKIRFMTYQGGLTSGKFIEFATRLIKGAKQKIFLIVDNLNSHKSKEVKKWLEAHSEEIEIIYLPSYSPDLNPSELVSSHLKKIVFKEKYPKDGEELGKLVLKAMKRIQGDEEKVKSLFEHPSVRYARAA